MDVHRPDTTPGSTRIDSKHSAIDSSRRVRLITWRSHFFVRFTPIFDKRRHARTDLRNHLFTCLANRKYKRTHERRTERTTENSLENILEFDLFRQLEELDLITKRTGLKYSTGLPSLHFEAVTSRANSTPHLSSSSANYPLPTLSPLVEKPREVAVQEALTNALSMPRRQEGASSPETPRMETAARETASYRQMDLRHRKIVIGSPKQYRHLA